MNTTVGFILRLKVCSTCFFAHFYSLFIYLRLRIRYGGSFALVESSHCIPLHNEILLLLNWYCDFVSCNNLCKSVTQRIFLEVWIQCSVLARYYGNRTETQKPNLQKILNEINPKVDIYMLKYHYSDIFFFSFYFKFYHIQSNM